MIPAAYIILALAAVACLYLQDSKVKRYIMQSEVRSQGELSELLPDFDTTKPIHVPPEWFTWPGKDEGKPCPPPIWY